MGVKPVWVEDIEGAPDGYMLTGQAAQDYADGAALRRLREALPERDIKVWVEVGDHGYIDNVALFCEVGSLAEYFGGATIAEAADKCREALS